MLPPVSGGGVGRGLEIAGNQATNRRKTLVADTFWYNFGTKQVAQGLLIVSLSSAGTALLGAELCIFLKCTVQTHASCAHCAQNSELSMRAPSELTERCKVSGPRKSPRTKLKRFAWYAGTPIPQRLGRVVIEHASITMRAETAAMLPQTHRFTCKC